MKKMLKPEIEFVKFSTEDVITTSGENTKYDLAADILIDGQDNENFGSVNWGINNGFPPKQ